MDGADAASSSTPRVIPESRRADGTVRRARKIREGYVAPEERQLYVPPALHRKAQDATLHETQAGSAQRPAASGEDLCAPRGRYIPPTLRRKPQGATLQETQAAGAQGPAAASTAGPESQTSNKEPAADGERPSAPRSRYVPPHLRKQTAAGGSRRPATTAAAPEASDSLADAMGKLALGGAKGEQCPAGEQAAKDT
ncbi:hypothetical protein IWQ57_001269 [Coemansia nantahalensis]|uniref:Uncharacterized protein n=1 Tax=Coemansia nantahalensis TaxID=2789366 RepID=A0ACC1K580_9FUNG|nr:hypothetical protein IWQ57_001269 [Coemansia nantahalensis]